MERRAFLVEELSKLEVKNAALRSEIASGVLASTEVGGDAAKASARFATIVGGCTRLCDTNQNLRHALTTLLKEQENLVELLVHLSTADKAKIVDLINKRFTDDDDEAGDGSGSNRMARLHEQSPKPFRKSFGRKDSIVSLHTVSDEPLSSVWEGMVELQSPAKSLLSGRDAVPEYVFEALQANRHLYLEAIAKGNSIGSDPDAFENFGFSLNQLPGYEYEFDEEDSETNIVLSNDRSSIKCATLNKLIERMTSEDKQDLNVRYTFLLTYNSFATPREVMRKLMSRHFMPIPPNMTPGEIKIFVKMRLSPVQIKVVGVLKQWLEDHYSDFYDDENLTTDLRLFIQAMLEVRAVSFYVFIFLFPCSFFLRFFWVCARGWYMAEFTYCFRYCFFCF